MLKFFLISVPIGTILTQLLMQNIFGCVISNSTEPFPFVSNCGSGFCNGNGNFIQLFLEDKNVIVLNDGARRVHSKGLATRTLLFAVRVLLIILGIVTTFLACSALMPLRAI